MRFSKYAIVSLAVMLLMLGASVSMDGDDAGVKTVQAKVVSVGSDSLTVEADKAGDGAVSLVLEIDEQTKLMKNGKPIDKSELSSGDRVSVNYKKQADDSLVALAISILS